MANSNRNRFTRRAAMAGGALALGGIGTFAFRGRSARGFSLSTADAKTLNRGNGAEPDTLDPHKAQGQWEYNIIGDMFIGLMTEDSAANPVPGACESYSVSGDGLTYRFRLRDHIWSDGVPVTAQDYVYSFRRIADPKFAAQYVSILFPIRNMEEASTGKLPVEAVGVRALDDRTLEIQFHFQVPYIEQLLTHFTTFAVPRHVVEKHGAQWLRPENIVVNGPYTLKQWIPNDHVQLVKNPRFFAADKVRIDNVFYFPTQDSEAALKRVRGGDFDVLTDSLPPQKIDWLRANMANELRLWPSILTQYVQFNVGRKPFDDVRVRTALSLAIDREIICNKVERAGEQPAYALVPPGMPGYPGRPKLNFHAMPMAQRLAKAKELLAAAGYGPGNPLSFDFNMTMTTEIKLISAAIQEMWRRIGVNVRLAPSETQVHYAVLRKHQFDVAWAGWIADYRDPKNYLYLFQASTADMNYGGYHNPKYEALVTRSDTIADAAVRTLVLEQAEQILLDDVAIAPVFFGVSRDLVSPQVKGWISNNINTNRTRYLSLDRRITSV
ncbi:MAG: peptide ABC transporter substrate-binding protein [Alphaproteobacteria bacterium]|nr:peptide ABC transporter substrate-binding protein [Alphaproteobacteria bacterium]MBV9692895.1 peptide ABC transporter substrate-binding protein [Alphaproteobacteria bacterium]